ncbi:hypothetical protein ID810_02495 [Actinomyces respiraculi]|uniref:SAF domain-containing protein n=1 Tax=Actinomyces respiraculi TaxID=2744574 RepID=A0A7T0PYC5_9ACTO|nr:hypothetical protein ID810_02495 [Actinomyces respiraculi]
MAAGVALVGASVVLGGWAVSLAADTQPLYVLAQDVVPGDDLTAEGVLTVVDSHPGTGSYVGVGNLPDDAVAAQALRAGDLLPASAVANGQDLALRAVVLNVASSLPAGTSTGDIVDLWALPAARTSTEAGSDEAAVVAQGLIVSRVGETDGAILGGTTTSVEVLVPEDLVGAVLTAVGQGGSLVLVPTGQLA